MASSQRTAHHPLMAFESHPILTDLSIYFMSKHRRRRWLDYNRQVLHYSKRQPEKLVILFAPDLSTKANSNQYMQRNNYAAR